MYLTNFHFYPYKNYLYSKPTKGLRGYGLGCGFAFNGKELDNETYGEGNAYDFGARIYDPRLGRWMSIDPLYKLYPEISPYAFCDNSPIMFKEVGGEGFNGGFSISNQSTATIIVVGSSKTIVTNPNGSVTETEFTGKPITLKPGQRLEAYYAETTDKNGVVTGKYTARVVQFAHFDSEKGTLTGYKDGPFVVNQDVNGWDVDYIKVQKDQTFIEEGGVFSKETRFNTNTNDKKAKTPNPPTGEGTIKIRPSTADYFIDKDDANEGSVTITGNKDALKIETGGESENKPKVNYGEGIPH